MKLVGVANEPNSWYSVKREKETINSDTFLAGIKGSDHSEKIGYEL